MQTRTPRLERQPHAQLNLPLRIRRRETKRLVGRKRTVAMHTWIADESSYHIVDTGKVRAVKNIEAFGNQLQASSLTQSNRAGQPQIDIKVIRAEAGVAANPDRTIVG